MSGRGDRRRCANRRRKLYRWAPISAAALIGSGVALGSPLTWTGSGTNWNNTSDWTPSGTPSSSSNLVFSTTGSTTSNVDAIFTVSSLTFSSTAQTFTIGGGSAVAVSSNVTDNAASAIETMGCPINIASSPVFSVVSGGKLVLNSLMAGAGELDVSGSGTVVVSNSANFFTGGVALVGGNLQFSSDGDFGTTAGTIAFYGGAMELLGSNTVLSARTVNLIGGAANIAVDSGSTLTLSGPVQAITGSGGVNQSGPGTLVLSGNNTYLGGTTIGGTVSVGSDTNLGSSGGGITFGSAFIPGVPFGHFATGTLLATGTFSSARGVTLDPSTALGITGGIVDVQSGQTLTLSGTVSGTANGLVKTDSGTLVLSGTNTFMGGVDVEGGIVSVTSDSNLGNTSGNLTLNNGTLDIAPANNVFETNRSITLGAGGGTITGPAYSLAEEGASFIGSISGSGGLTVTSRPLSIPGLVALDAINSYMGGTTVTGTEVLSPYNDSSLGNASGAVTLNQEGTLAAGSQFFSTPRAIHLGSDGGGSLDSAGTTLTVTGVIDGGSTTGPSLRVNDALGGGQGIVLLLNANTFSNDTLVQSGTLAAGPMPHGTTGSPLGTGRVYLNSGTTLSLQGGVIGTTAQQALAATGYNNDVVVERNPVNGFANAANAFDTSNDFAFYENGYMGHTTGLPQGGTFTNQTNAAVPFQLQPYTGKNVLQLSPQAFGQLALTQPGEFNTISFLATSASGATSLQIALYFTDGSEAIGPMYTVPDWFTANSPGALVVNGRISLASGNIQDENSGYPQLYEFDYTLPAADQNKVVGSIGFANLNNTGGGTLGVFALSGDGALTGPTQTYSNPISVPSDATSTINVTGSPTATIGGLYMAFDSTLNVTATPASFLVNWTGSTTGTLNAGILSLDTDTGFQKNNTTFNTAAGTTLVFGAVSGGTAITKTGVGTMVFSVAPTISSLTVSQGTAALATASKSVMTLGALNFSGSMGAWVGLLDMSSDDAIVNNGNLGNITNQIKQGRNGGVWTGTGGITTSAAPQTTNMGLAVELNNQGNGAVLMSSFDGQLVVNTDVLVKYTYVGDANLDGVVNGSDYTLIDNAYNTHAPAIWRDGDFNYDGVINGDDYILIDNSFNTEELARAAGDSVGPAEMIASDTEQVADVSTAVPEPGSLGLLVIGAVGLMRRARRGRSCRRAPAIY